MLMISVFSLKKEEENHKEHGTQQEDRVPLAVDVKGLVGLWDHGKGCWSRQAKGISCPVAARCCFNCANP